MNKLDQIEKRIRSLFETSTAVIPWSDPNDRMVHELSIAIQDLFMGGIPADQLTAPVFQINLNPQTFYQWKNQPEWEKTLINLLVSSAQEYNVHFQTLPTVKLSADASLMVDDVAITLKESASPARAETSAVSLVESAAPASLNPQDVKTPILILQDGKTIPLNRSVINLGRKSTNHIVINDLRISRVHAQIRRVKNDYILFDVGSTGGTYVNSNRIEQHTLRPGDVISLAGYSMIFASDLESPENPKKGITSELRCTEEGE